MQLNHTHVVTRHLGSIHVLEHRVHVKKSGVTRDVVYLCLGFYFNFMVFLVLSSVLQQTQKHWLPDFCKSIVKIIVKENSSLKHIQYICIEIFMLCFMISLLIYCLALCCIFIWEISKCVPCWCHRRMLLLLAQLK